MAGLLEAGLDPDIVVQEMEAVLEADEGASRRAAAAVTAWGFRELAQRALEGSVLDWADRAEPALGAAVGALWQAFELYSPNAPAEALRLTAKQARAAYAKAAVAYLGDLAMEKSLAGARQALEARTGAEAEGGLESEYEAGQLYRLGAGDQPILKPAANPSVGHLFVDVKDFTRRTALLGQAAMADFLRREFYLPVLAFARTRSSAPT